jgi:hypothetical protein
MTRTVVSLVAVLLSTASFAQTAAQPLCVLDPAQLPATWQPSADVAADLNPAPWSTAEAEDARTALASGVREMIDYFAEHEKAIPDIWEDSVAALIEVTYSSVNPPELDAAARAAAIGNLNRLVEPYMDDDADEAACGDVEEVMPLAMYASRFYAEGDLRTAHMVATTNAAIADCDGLEGLLGYNFPQLPGDKPLGDDKVFDLVIWSLLFVEGELIPGLVLPQEYQDFSPALWNFLQTYEIRDAWTYEDGAEDDTFVEAAYLATHIAYIPTGNHRFPLYIADAPELYRFHRENFYPMLEMGELDLVAEVVDGLRQYGCKPENDIQVRDGTRYLLEVWHDGDESWMAYREPGEKDSQVEPYDFIHKAWTGVLGVRERSIEVPAEGNYGGVVRNWLPAPVAD